MLKRSWTSWLFLLALLGEVALVPWSAQCQVDKDALRALLEKEILKESLVSKQVYVSPEPLLGGKYVVTWRKRFQVPRNFSRAWFFFIDDMPKANWEHPCRYVFVDAKTHAHVVVKAMTPPKDLSSMVSLDSKQ